MYGRPGEFRALCFKSRRDRRERWVGSVDYVAAATGVLAGLRERGMFLCHAREWSLGLSVFDVLGVIKYNFKWI